MRRRAAAVVLVAAVLGGAAYGIVRAVSGDGGAPGFGARDAAGLAPDYAFEIPAGTGSRLDAGEQLELLPQRIDARVGEVIRIANDDDRGYLLGPFYVGPRETLTQQFTVAGTFQGRCVVHPSGELVVTVEG